MKVSGLQLDIAWENPEESFRRAEVLLRSAAKAGSRLAVLPEMFATGFTMDAPRAAAAADVTRQWLAGAARRHGLWVLGGFAEPFEPRPRNAAALFDPSGEECLLYHKLHPFSLAREHEHYAAGDEVFTVDVEGLRVTPLICYDLRFPEPFRLAADKTDLFCVIANWPEPRAHAWRSLLVARAIENQAWVLGVNRVGEDGNGHRYRGDTALVDPMGETVATDAERPARIDGEVSADHVADVRRRFTFLADRRRDLL